MLKLLLSPTATKRTLRRILAGLRLRKYWTLRLSRKDWFLMRRRRCICSRLKDPMVLVIGSRSSARQIGTSPMSDLPNLLSEIVLRQGRENKVALLLSAGLDSVTTGIACQHAGKTIHAYTYELHGYRSYERERVESIARHFGWELTVVTVPTRGLAADFKRLAIGLRCRKKVQFEVSYPLLYVIPAIEESEIWTGWNADDHYGNTREYLFCQARLKRKGAGDTQRKEHFDAHRRSTYEEFDSPHAAHTFWKAVTLAKQHG